MPTPAQLEALAAGRAKANENRRRAKARRDTGLDVEEPLGAADAPATPAAAPPDPSADTAPGGSGGPRVRPAGNPQPRTQSLAKIRAGLISLFTMTGVGLSMVDAFDGQVVAMNAAKLADSWADLAAQDARVRRALEALLAGSAWGTALTTTAMVALPIAAHHRLAPPQVAQMAAQAGVVVPTEELPPPPPVRVRRPMGDTGETSGSAERAQSAAPPETAPVPPSEEVASWDAGAQPEVVDAGGISFPGPPIAPPSG